MRVKILKSISLVCGVLGTIIVGVVVPIGCGSTAGGAEYGEVVTNVMLGVALGGVFLWFAAYFLGALAGHYEKAGERRGR